MSPDPINNRGPLDAAQRLAIQHEVETLGLAGKRIRVLRALTFEGDAEMVLRQLAQSLPIGTREWGKPTVDGARPLSLTIAQGEIEIIEAKPTPARIHLFDIDPAELVGIAPCDDGSPGWVVMHQTGDGMREPYKTEPVCDDIGQIVYFDVQDAAEVCLSGKFWKHDMGEGEPDALDEAEDATPAGQEG